MKNRIHIILILMAGILLLSSAASMGSDKRNSNLKVKLNEVASYIAMRDTKNLVANNVYNSLLVIAYLRKSSRTFYL
jgi:protein involved in sex pheromone biosynthesis